MKSLLICSFFCLFASLLLPFSVAADANFHMAVIADYTFDQQGKSHVRQQVSLTNESSNLYASSYQLTIAGSTPQNLTGFDVAGPLKITATPQKDSDTTMLNLVFNQPAVGRGNTQRFTVEYDSNPAIKNGQVWEIVLPKLAQSQIIDTYILNLHVPDSFGTPAFISPSPSSSQTHVYSFTKDQLTESGVVAAFGHLQTYSFNFTYHLSNPENKKVVRTITLPPDTAYQKIYYEDLSPHPDTVSVDTDGNWLAKFTLAPKQNMGVSAAGQVRLYGNPGPAPVPPPSSTLDEYLRPPDPNFTSTDPTDSYIFQSRSNGIPTRKLVGIIFSTGDNSELHTWPEHWDNELQTWVSLDPIFSFDTNHFVFAIDGMNLESTHLNPTNIQIELGQYRNHAPEFPEVNLKKPFAFLPFIKNQVSLEIHNNQGRAAYKLPLTIASAGMELASDPSRNQILLPPFSKLVIPVTFKSSFFPKVSSLFLHVKLSDRTLTYNIPQHIFFVWYGIFILIISAFLIGLAAIAVHAWSLHLQGRDRHDYLRRQGQKPQK